MTVSTSPFDAFHHLLRPEHATVAALVQDALSRVEDLFAKQISSRLEPVQTLCRHVERYRGKMLRPTMVILSGLACRPDDDASLPVGEVPLPGRVSDEHITIAAVVEMIHVATLVHDDVLDEAATRRGGPTVNNLRGNEAAVILGDYLISNAFHLCSQLDSQTSSLLIGAVTTRLCEGELLQLYHRDDFALDEKTYYEIVERKTAELIGVATELGAKFAGASARTRRRMRDFGIKLGVAFQIQDDLLDLTGREDVVGKSVGKDLEKGKLTLPLIHHLTVADAPTRERALANLRFAARGDHDQGREADLLAALHATGSIEYARQTAQRLVDEAKTLLEGSAFGPAATLLVAMADSVVARAR
ncbi:MAG: polyprenyl synthetase family protein [Phycisphaeraceae bacterium]|nr:polyprenyl synthetase family protein [Phycisphaeraceae bacterium]